MALGINPVLAEDMLEWLTDIAEPAAPATDYFVQWHTAEPGIAGATAIATTAFSTPPTRHQMVGTTSYFVVGTADDGEVENRNAGESAEADGSQTITHFSIWSAATSGTFLFSGDLDSPQAVTAGGKLTYGAGDLTVSISGAA